MSIKHERFLVLQDQGQPTGLLEQDQARHWNEPQCSLTLSHTSALATPGTQQHQPSPISQVLGYRLLDSHLGFRIKEMNMLRIDADFQRLLSDELLLIFNTSKKASTPII
uniref:Uncharacterized protein n=1 Tax=uncultured Planctomycetales bacterium HF0130_29M04 TaxID=723552 RepID=E7C3E6_9BACT|nr:hypothetical protein [uncultured Planctomycetales bacterium HF0130_29M04]